MSGIYKNLNFLFLLFLFWLLPHLYSCFFICLAGPPSSTKAKLVTIFPVIFTFLATDAIAFHLPMLIYLPPSFSVTYLTSKHNISSFNFLVTFHLPSIIYQFLIANLCFRFTIFLATLQFLHHFLMLICFPCLFRCLFVSFGFHQSSVSSIYLFWLPLLLDLTTLISFC